IAVSMAIAFYSHPAKEYARDMDTMGVTYERVQPPSGKPERPGERLEYSPVLTVFIAFCGIAYMVREVGDKGFSVILELNHYIFLFLIAGLLLHWRPRFFVHAVTAAVPSVAGVL